MQINYRGFEGKLTYDMDRDVYYVSGVNEKGWLATAESAACKGGAVWDVIFQEFRVSVDMILEETEEENNNG